MPTKTNNNKITVGLLLGGRSSEHEVSLTSGASVLQEIDQDKFAVVPIFISRTGEWFYVDDPELLAPYAKKIMRQGEHELGTSDLAPVALDYAHGNSLIELSRSKCFQLLARLDVLFPILHGPYGEDGTIQGLCEMAQLPCVGAGILGSAAGLDKIAMKALFVQAGLPVLPYVFFTKAQWQAQEREIISRIWEKLQLPLFVKPANCGSSVGVSKVKDIEKLKEAVATAARFDRKLIVEQGIPVREVECGVLGNDVPQASIVGEVISHNEFYDYAAKYGADNSHTIIPAPISDETARAVQQLAIKAFQAIDCAGFARVDCFIHQTTQKIVVNEINTIPGFTPKSMFPTLWGQSGIGYQDLITRLIELAMERFHHAQKSYSSV